MLRVSSPRLLQNLSRCYYTSCKLRSEHTTGSTNNDNDLVLPEEPTHCCMTGCADCVWIKYAQELALKYKNGDVIAKQKIMEKVPDPKIRAFLFTQLGLESNEKK